MTTCSRIAIAFTALLATATAGNAQCHDCGHAHQRVHAGRCYPNCSTACRTCALRPRMTHHGRKGGVKDKSIPAIARFHPVPTRPVFEPRHVAPAFAPPIVNSVRLPSEEPPKVPSPASVLKHAEAEGPKLTPPPVEQSQVSDGSKNRRASYTSPAHKPRPTFAWFFLPDAE